jgi:hypothetical protein
MCCIDEERHSQATYCYKNYVIKRQYTLLFRVIGASYHTSFMYAGFSY